MIGTLIEVRLGKDSVSEFERIAGIVDYRIGWYMVRNGKPYSECTSDAMRDGWIASHDEDATLRAVGVRESGVEEFSGSLSDPTFRQRLDEMWAGMLGE